MRVVSHKSLLALALLAASSAAMAAPVGWRDMISAGDANRILALEESRDRGIQAVQQGEGSGDFRAIKETLEPGGRAVPARALLGNWHCRQMKLGGMSPYIVYDWYSCRVSVVGGNLFLEKLNGSLRTAGFLYPENGAWVYLGAASVGNEPMHRYSGPGASIGASVTPDDQVGLLTGIGDNHLRLEIAAPVQESVFDMIEFAR
jgi:hypothetical protein